MMNVKASLILDVGEVFVEVAWSAKFQSITQNIAMKSIAYVVLPE